MKKIKKLIGTFLLICLCAVNVPSTTKAEGMVVTFNPVSYTHDRYPELSGTVSDPMADVSVFVGYNGVMAENKGDGTWIIPINSFGPFADGTYDVRVEAANESTSEAASNDYLGGLIVKDDYSMPPQLDCSNTIDSSNAGSYIVSGRAESNAAVHILIDDHFGTSVEGLDYADWNGNFVFSPKDISSLWDGEVTITAVAIDDGGAGAMSEESIYTINKNTSSLPVPSLNNMDIVKQGNQNNFNFSGTGTASGKLYYSFEDSNGSGQSGFVNVNGSGEFLGNIDLISLNDGDVTVRVGSKLGDERSLIVIQTITKDTLGPDVYDVSTGTFRDTDIFLVNVNGYTEPDSTVKFRFQNSDKNVSGETISDGNGKFELKDLDLSDLPDGNIVLSLSSVDEIGNEGGAVTRTLAKETFADNKGNRSDTDASDPANANPVVVTATAQDSDPVGASGTLPIAGPDSISILIITGLALLVGIRIRGLKRI